MLVLEAVEEGVILEDEDGKAVTLPEGDAEAVTLAGGVEVLELLAVADELAEAENDVDDVTVGENVEVAVLDGVLRLIWQHVAARVIQHGTSSSVPLDVTWTQAESAEGMSLFGWPGPQNADPLFGMKSSGSHS